MLVNVVPDSAFGREAKISNDRLPFFGHNDIIWLDISVSNIFFGKIFEPRSQFQQYLAAFRKGDRFCFNKLFQCFSFNILYDHIIGFLSFIESKYFYYIWVLHLSQNLHLIFKSDQRFRVCLEVIFQKCLDSYFFVI